MTFLAEATKPTDPDPAHSDPAYRAPVYPDPAYTNPTPVVSRLFARHPKLADPVSCYFQHVFATAIEIDAFQPELSQLLL
jgi:hypothetical protein